MEEEKFCKNVHTLADAADRLANCERPPRCDLVDECLPDKPIGLSDRECNDVLLVQAVMRADTNDIMRALSQGANVDTVAGLSINMGEAVAAVARDLTPLMRAASLGHAEVVPLLLKERADIWRHDSAGWTPLCHALASGEFDIARRLLAESKSGTDRQKAIAQRMQSKVVEQCEESAGPEAAETLRKEFAE